MSATEQDRTRAISALAQAADEGRAVEVIAELLAAERERVLAPVLALAGFYAGNFYPFVGDDVAQAIRRAAQDGAE